jgi:hypothetical protein
VRDRGPGDRDDGGAGVGVEAHGRDPALDHARSITPGGAAA